MDKKGIISLPQLFAQGSYYFYFTLRDLGANSIIIVYQMGKVGSSTITKTLEILSLNMPVYQVHHLTDEGLRMMEYKSSIGWRPTIRRRAYWAGRYLQHKLAPGVFKNRKWFVVTLTRDPVARNISGFFHTLKRFHPDLYADFGVVDNETLFPRLKEAFLLDFPHNKPLNWFDDEMKKVLDIDVYKQSFPWKRGYDIIQKENVRLLILRLEDIHSCIHTAFEEWLGKSFDLVTVKSANRAGEKPYEPYYRAFKNWLVLPDDYLRRMYESKFARHYYSADELDLFWKRWTGLEREGLESKQA